MHVDGDRAGGACSNGTGENDEQGMGSWSAALRVLQDNPVLMSPASASDSYLRVVVDLRYV